MFVLLKSKQRKGKFMGWLLLRYDNVNKICYNGANDPFFPK